MDLRGSLNYLLGGRRDIWQRLRASNGERYDTRDRGESIVRNINEAKGMVIESMEK